VSNGASEMRWKYAGVLPNPFAFHQGSSMLFVKIWGPTATSSEIAARPCVLQSSMTTHLGELSSKQYRYNHQAHHCQYPCKLLYSPVTLIKLHSRADASHLVTLQADSELAGFCLAPENLFVLLRAEAIEKCRQTESKQNGEC